MILVQPFKQTVIWKPKFSIIPEAICIDKLDADLNYKHPILEVETADPKEALSEAIQQGLVSKKGWVELDIDFVFDWTDVWSEAVKKLLQK
jgi:hypothetical protein